MRLYRKESPWAAYARRTRESGVFCCPLEKALPQTVIAKTVRRHMENRNGKAKKAVIIGFDGARADCIAHLIQKDEEQNRFHAGFSGLEWLCQSGGVLLSYAGGEKENPQQTLTQQGWASILTGEWSAVHGVVDFDVMTGAETILAEYAAKGKKTAFFGIWPHHFEVTYSAEMERIRRESLPCAYVQCREDGELTERMIRAVTEENRDITMGILEAPDNAGHHSGFSEKNPMYMRALFSCDHDAYRIIRAIESRPTYAEEDWLIVITSDHGGHLDNHGSQDVRDRTTFIACNQLESFQKEG